MIIVSDFIYGFCIYVILFLLRGKTDFGFYLKQVIIPEGIYTIVVTILLYPLIMRINKLLEKDEKVLNAVAMDTDTDHEVTDSRDIGDAEAHGNTRGHGVLQRTSLDDRWGAGDQFLILDTFVVAAHHAHGEVQRDGVDDVEVLMEEGLRLD